MLTSSLFLWCAAYPLVQACMQKFGWVKFRKDRVKMQIQGKPSIFFSWAMSVHNKTLGDPARRMRHMNGYAGHLTTPYGHGLRPTRYSHQLTAVPLCSRQPWASSFWNHSLARSCLHHVQNGVSDQGSQVPNIQTCNRFFDLSLQTLWRGGFRGITGLFGCHPEHRNGRCNWIFEVVGRKKKNNNVVLLCTWTMRPPVDYHQWMPPPKQLSAPLWASLDVNCVKHHLNSETSGDSLPLLGMGLKCQVSS